MVLMILRRAPKNGAEIIQEMDTLSRGFWRPSPGSVYPLLEELTKDGFIRKREDGRYELSEKVAADTFWGWPGMSGPRDPEEVVREFGHLTSYFEDLVKNDPEALKAVQKDLDQVVSRLRKLGP